MFVQAPCAAFETGPFEGAQHTPAPPGLQRPPDNAVQQRVLRGEHGAPDHLAFPGPVFSLEPQEALGRAPQCRTGVGRFDFLRAGRPGGFDTRRHGVQERAGEVVPGLPAFLPAFAPRLPQVANAAPEPPEANGERMKDGPGPTRCEPTEGQRGFPCHRPGDRSAKCEGHAGRGPVFAGQYPRGPVPVHRIRPPAPVDRVSEGHRLRTMIGEDLVEPHCEELGNAARPETFGGEVLKALVLGERQRIAETEGHADRRHGMVVPGRIADQHPARTPVCGAQPHLIGRRIELTRLQCIDEGRSKCARQQPGAGFRQEADPVPGRPAVQRNIDDDPYATIRQTVYENRARPAQHDMSVAFERQARFRYRDPQHPRAEHRVRGQAQRLAHDRGPAVGADNAGSGYGAFRAIYREGNALVIDRIDPRVGKEVDIGLVLDGFAEARNKQRVVACQTPGSVRIREQDRLGSVLRKNRESLADRAVGQRVDVDPDVAQHPDGRRMQPFARESPGRPGIRFEQGHPGAFSRVRQGAQAPYRTCADNGYVVAPRCGHAHWKTPGSERRR